MPIKTYGSAVYGIEAIAITIEVNISSGLKYYMVGLPENAVKESMLRVESAQLKTSMTMHSGLLKQLFAR